MVSRQRASGGAAQLQQRREPAPSPWSGGPTGASDVDVVVVGAGQAGLAIGHFLARQGRRFLLVDAADAVASAWRRRWGSLVLLTPRRYDALPGMPFPGDPDGYPCRDEVVAYLEHYAASFELPLRLSSPVRSLTRSGARFLVGLDDVTIQAEQVVVATGPFHVPVVPSLVTDLDADVFQVHSADYRRPDDVPQGRVLVVGGGNTGFQIAKELSASRSVQLSVGSRQTPLPQRLLGRDVFWWLSTTGLITTTVDTRIGRRAQHRDTLVGSSRRQLPCSGGSRTTPRSSPAGSRPPPTLVLVRAHRRAEARRARFPPTTRGLRHAGQLADSRRHRRTLPYRHHRARRGATPRVRGAG